MYLHPAFRAGIRCGNVREEETLPLKYRSNREEKDLISVFFGALSALCNPGPPAAKRGGWPSDAGPDRPVHGWTMRTVR